MMGFRKNEIYGLLVLLAIALWACSDPEITGVTDDQNTIAFNSSSSVSVSTEGIPHDSVVVVYSSSAAKHEVKSSTSVQSSTSVVSPDTSAAPDTPITNPDIPESSAGVPVSSASVPVSSANTPPESSAGVAGGVESSEAAVGAESSSESEGPYVHHEPVPPPPRCTYKYQADYSDSVTIVDTLISALLSNNTAFGPSDAVKKANAVEALYNNIGWAKPSYNTPVTAGALYVLKFIFNEVGDEEMKASFIEDLVDGNAQKHDACKAFQTSAEKGYFEGSYRSLGNLLDKVYDGEDCDNSESIIVEIRQKLSSFYAHCQNLPVCVESEYGITGQVDVESARGPVTLTCGSTGWINEAAARGNE